MTTPSTLVPRKLKVTVHVNRPNASGAVTGYDYVWTDNRIKVHVQDGGSSWGNARIEIFGVPMNDLNNIARVWPTQATPITGDTVLVEVWNAQNAQYVPFFQGIIMWSTIEVDMPNVALVIESNSAGALLQTSASPYSNAGYVDLGDALKAIVAPSGFTVNYLPSANKYTLPPGGRFTGSVGDQVRQAVGLYPDLRFWTHLNQLVVNESQAAPNESPFIVSVANGMIGSPGYGSSSVTFNTLFRPEIIIGASVQFQTILTFLQGMAWNIGVASHTLEANMPNGKWISSFAAQPVGAPVGTPYQGSAPVPQTP